MLNVANKPFMLSVVMLIVIMLSVLMLSVVMLSVIMLSVVKLSVVAPTKPAKTLKRNRQFFSDHFHFPKSFEISNLSGTSSLRPDIK